MVDAMKTIVHKDRVREETGMATLGVLGQVAGVVVHDELGRDLAKEQCPHRVSRALGLALVDGMEAKYSTVLAKGHLYHSRALVMFGASSALVSARVVARVVDAKVEVVPDAVAAGVETSVVDPCVKVGAGYWVFL